MAGNQPDTAAHPLGHPPTNQAEPANFQFSPFDQKEFNFSQNLPSQRLNAINNTAKYKIVDRGQTESRSPGDHGDPSKLSEQIHHAKQSNQSNHSDNNSFAGGPNESRSQANCLNNSLANNSTSLNSHSNGNLSNKLSVNPNIRQNLHHQTTHTNQTNGRSDDESSPLHAPTKPVNVSPALSSASSGNLSDFVPSASSSVTDLAYQTKSTSSVAR